MKSLDGHLPKMLLNCKVYLNRTNMYKLVIGDGLIAVLVVSKHVRNDISDLILVLIQYVDECPDNFWLFK